SNYRSLYIPRQFAHGFLTLQDNSEVSYHMSEFYAPSAARGIRWDDPILHIEWPEPIVIVSEKDQMWPQFHLNG
ncbi:MAG TPA: dTDP-4-dehydrorhamnose 3,5-epimerase family protein, partial [Nitrospira sp.]|nr:dTDP-4-dehydrorhamnose 3,5-epimerase family protein [Nitrospira sp.]